MNPVLIVWNLVNLQILSAGVVIETVSILFWHHVIVWCMKLVCIVFVRHFAKLHGLRKSDAIPPNPPAMLCADSKCLTDWFIDCLKVCWMHEVGVYCRHKGYRCKWTTLTRGMWVCCTQTVKCNGTSWGSAFWPYVNGIVHTTWSLTLQYRCWKKLLGSITEMWDNVGSRLFLFRITTVINFTFLSANAQYFFSSILHLL